MTLKQTNKNRKKYTEHIPEPNVNTNIMKEIFEDNNNNHKPIDNFPYAKFYIGVIIFITIIFIL